ncbi:type II toxin-antitoxin system RelE/ParE family toxin [Chitinophaga lutea]
MRAGVFVLRNTYTDLKRAFDSLRERSPQTARRFRDCILRVMQRLEQFPLMYPPDKYCHSNDGTFRAFECERHRVSYRAIASYIIVFRIRHTRMQPQYY